MTDMSVLLASTFPPRHDGLATFAEDLQEGLSSRSGVAIRVIAIDPEGESLHYERRVVGRISQGDPESYTRAADVVQRVRPDVLCVEHEFGLWGEFSQQLDADSLVPFLDAVKARAPDLPVVTTLHTVRPSPDKRERDVLADIVERSTASVVMARMGAMLLMDDYGIPTDSIVHIPHGVPVVERKPRRTFKRQLGLEGRTIISTFGLLDPRKGIEYAIRAMQPVAERYPEALYLLVGETHPEYRKRFGEQYRNELRTLVRELSLTENVRFVNQYLDEREVVDYLQASDVYLTPYLDRNQITSGTLAFALGTGKAIISTPYIHATEALAEGRGLLAEFRSADSISNCLLLLLDNPDVRHNLEQRALQYGSEHAWPIVGQRYLDLFQRVIAGRPLTDLLALEPEPIQGGS